MRTYVIVFLLTALYACQKPEKEFGGTGNNSEI